jgi:hypothetical protein
VLDAFFLVIHPVTLRSTRVQLRAANIRRLRVLGEAWRGWEAFRIARRGKHRAIAALLARVMASDARSVLSAWKSYTDPRAAHRKFCNAALLRICHVRARTSLNEWRFVIGKNVLHRKQLLAAAATGRARDLGRALRGWKLAILRCRRRRVVMPAVAARYALHRLRAGLEAWSVRVAAAREHDAKIASAVALHSHTVLRKAIAALTSHRASRLKWKRVMRATLSRTATGNRRRGLRRWREVTRALRVAKLLALRTRRSALLVHLSAWLHAFREIAVLKHNGIFLVGRLEAVVSAHRLARSFRTWVCHKRAKKLAAARTAVIDRRVGLRALRAHMAAWHDMAVAQVR